MKPGQFDIDTAREMVGDAKSRTIEDDARRAASEGRYSPSDGVIRGIGSTYFDSVMLEMESRIWLSAYQKRKDRLERIKQSEETA